MTRYSLYLLIALFSSCASQNKNDSGHDKLEHIIGKYRDSLSIPGISTAIIHHGELVFKHSSGYMNLEYEIPMTDSSVFRVWSISKQFCAAAVFKLIEQGKLSLVDQIGSIMDSIPEGMRKVTVQQLLNHTSGTRDYMNDFSEGRMMLGWTFEQVRDSIARLNFPPGEDWRYSNSGYWILSKLVETISGQSYQDYLSTAFFKPLGLNDTYKIDFNAIVHNRVSGYDIIEGTPYNATKEFDEKYTANGDGELMSTLNDLIKWTQSLIYGNIFSAQTLETAWTPALLNNKKQANASSVAFYDEASGYGSGWFISKMGETKIVWTPGAGTGVSTTILTIPDKNISIIVLCNSGEFLIADRIARDIASTYLD